jgi:hypothetical protein
MNAPFREISFECNGTAPWRPGELRSLWDIMMNYGILGLCHLLQDLSAFEEQLGTRIAAAEAMRETRAKELHKFIDPNVIGFDQVGDLDVQRVKGWVQFSAQQAKTAELQGVEDRIEIFDRKLRLYNPMSLHELLAEVRALREAFESSLRFKYFYLYPQAKGLMVLKIEDDWKVIIDAFPVCKDDAKAATDCYALGHHTASVFHSMCVAEYGLRAVAKERRIKLPKNKPVEWGTWQDIIRELDDEIKVIGGKKAGAAKDAALEFTAVPART